VGLSPQRMSTSTEDEPATGRAHGKLILLGEHAVVHGTPALVAGIELGVEATLRLGGEGQRMTLLERGCVARSDGDELGRALRALLQEGGAPDALELSVKGDLPPGMGLGFSAAAAVAIARAVENHLRGEAADERVLARATAWERVFHGNPSGVDVAAAMRGGCTRFTRAEGTRPVPLRHALTVAVGLTGTASSTREMVEAVAELKRRTPEVADRCIDGIATLVDNAISACEAGDAVALGELLNLNQMLLAGLMVSTSTIEDMVAIARDAGALGAKLTGAGGGGAVFALAGTDASAVAIADAVVAAWKEAGFAGFVTRIGGAS
jgi:mevalonate kinase